MQQLLRDIADKTNSCNSPYVHETFLVHLLALFSQWWPRCSSADPLRLMVSDQALPEVYCRKDVNNKPLKVRMNDKWNKFSLVIKNWSKDNSRLVTKQGNMFDQKIIVSPTLLSHQFTSTWPAQTNNIKFLTYLVSCTKLLCDVFSWFTCSVHGKNVNIWISVKLSISTVYISLSFQ